jgi:O-antigen/teichoic acid export membrane protein
VVGALAAVGFTMLLSRSLGAEAMGQVSVAISLAMVMALACTANIETGGMRFMVADLANGDLARVRGYMRFSRRFVILTSVVATCAGLAWLTWRAEGTLPQGHLLLAMLAAPLLGWMRLGAGFAMGFSRPVLAVLPRTMFRPVAFLGMIAGWVSIVGVPSPEEAMALFAFSILLVLGVQQLLLSHAATKAMGPAAGQEDVESTDWPEWVKVSLTLGLNVLFVEYSIYIAVLCASLVLTSAEVALLDITLKLMALLKFGVTAVNQVFAPRLSRAMATGDNAQLTRWLAVSGVMKLGVVSVGLVIAVVLGQWALGLFGDEFPAAYTLLMLLLLDPVLVVLFGPASNVVSFSKQPHALLPVLAATLLVLVGGVIVLGYLYGVMGVGAAIVAARLIWVVWLAAFCWRKFGVDPTIAALPRGLFVGSK